MTALSEAIMSPVSGYFQNVFGTDALECVNSWNGGHTHPFLEKSLQAEKKKRKTV